MRNMKRINPDKLSEAQTMARRIEGWLEKLCATDANRHEAAQDILYRLDQEHGFRWRTGSEPQSLAFGGVSSSCTAGGIGLLRNWCAAVQRKARALEAAS